MARYFSAANARLRLDDDGSLHYEIVIPTAHTTEVVAEWQIDYLPHEAQERLRALLTNDEQDASHLDVPITKPDKGPGTHPRN